MNREKIVFMVVDNDHEVRALVSRVLRHYFVNASIVMGIDSRDGLREFKESKPHLVITDLRMETPFAGLDLAKEIKRIAPSTKVILMSGNLPDNIKGVNCVDRAILKPFLSTILVAMLKQFGF